MRLIDADELKEKAYDTYNYYGYVEVVRVDDIDSATTVDPVKHGKWIHCLESDLTFISFGYTCSACLHTMYCCSVKEPSELPKYCSDCGAKMDL